MRNSNRGQENNDTAKFPPPMFISCVLFCVGFFFAVKRKPSPGSAICCFLVGVGACFASRLKGGSPVEDGTDPSASPVEGGRGPSASV